MPQELNVLSCYSCKTFQAHIVKKANKWQCKMCGEKQSIIKVHFQGSGVDCRHRVQELNFRRATEDRPESETWEDVDFQAVENECTDYSNRAEPTDSLWAKYSDELPNDKNVDDDELSSNDTEFKNNPFVGSLVSKLRSGNISHGKKNSPGKSFQHEAKSDAKRQSRIDAFFKKLGNENKSNSSKVEALYTNQQRAAFNIASKTESDSNTRNEYDCSYDEEIKIVHAEPFHSFKRIKLNEAENTVSSRNVEISSTRENSSKKIDILDLIRNSYKKSTNINNCDEGRSNCSFDNGSFLENRHSSSEKKLIVGQQVPSYSKDENDLLNANDLEAGNLISNKNMREDNLPENKAFSKSFTKYTMPVVQNSKWSKYVDEKEDSNSDSDNENELSNNDSGAIRSKNPQGFESVQEQFSQSSESITDETIDTSPKNAKINNVDTKLSPAENLKDSAPKTKNIFETDCDDLSEIFDF